MYTKTRPKAPGEELEGRPICSLHKQSRFLSPAERNQERKNLLTLASSENNTASSHHVKMRVTSIINLLLNLALK